MESHGQVACLWGAALVFGNLFALLWAAVSVCNTYPEYWCKFKGFWTSSGTQRIAAQLQYNNLDASSTSSSKKGLWWLTKSPSLRTARVSRPTKDACTELQPSCQQQQQREVHFSACIAQANSADVLMTIGAASPANDHALSVRDRVSPAQGRAKSPDRNVHRIQLAWRGVGLTTKSKTVLQHVYGTAEPGEVHAVIGPSGCGKSVLLELLAMRLGNSTKQQKSPALKGASSNLPAKTDSTGHSAACVLGQVLVDGQAVTRQQLQAVSAYMPETETDGLVPVMTAYEMVAFCTALLLPHLNKEQQRVRAETVLDMLGLAEQHNTLVGGLLPGGTAVRGLSGGERKRCSIACAVVSLPRILLLDGPLSGLDSFAALSVVRYLTSIAKQQHAAVVFSLHQPRAAIWAQMNKVTLLAAGRMMYSGTTDDLVPWFNSLGFSYRPTVHGLVPDWALDLVSLGFSNCEASNATANYSNGSASKDPTQAAAVATQQHLQLQCTVANNITAGFGEVCSSDPLAAAADAFLWHLRDQQPEWFEANVGKLPVTVPAEGKSLSAGNSRSGASCVSLSGMDLDMQPPQESGGRCGWLRAPCVGAALRRYKALLWREALLTTRNPLNVAGRALIFTYVGLFFGLIFFDMGGAASSIPVRMAVVNTDLMFLVLVAVISLPLFYEDTKYFVHDIKAGLYRPLEYLLARSTVSVPFTIVMGAVLHFLFYGMAGMRHGAVYMLQSCALAVLLLLIAAQVIQLCAMAASSQDLAFVLVSLWIAININVHPYYRLFTDYTLNMSWLRYVTAVNWAWQGAVAVELKDRYFDCSHGSGLSALGMYTELLPIHTPILSMVKEQVDNLGDGCIASGNAVLAMYTQQLQYGAIFGLLLAYYILMLIMTYLAALGKAKKALAR